MSEQALDLRRSLQIVRRHWMVVVIFAVLGLLAGAVYTVRTPPALTSTALVMLPSQVHDTATQKVVASSDTVLAHALRSTDPGVSAQALRRRITVTSPTFNVIAISAQGRTAAQAERTANAVADSYIGFLGSGMTSHKVIRAQVLQPATYATGRSLPARLLDSAGPGALLGILIGAIAALAMGRSDRRLRERDEIAESIGVPVLASIPVDHPAGAAGWRRLLEDYQPGAVDAWRLHQALQQLELADADTGGSSLAVLSLSSDRKALALGPQLAVFTASLGIPTALVIGPPEDGNTTATLRAACVTPPAPERLQNLRVTVSDRDASVLPAAGLTVVVAVVDDQAPRVGDAMRTTATVLGVSAGAATAEQLARVAASATADGRHIAGILVADPATADHTTGRLPKLAHPVRRKMPTRMTGTVTGARQ